MKYPALFLISFVMRAVGISILVLGIVASIAAALSGPSVTGVELFKVDSEFVGIAGVLTSIVVSSIFYAFGELIKLMIDIEENTRR